jgi:hypothetical protein
VTEKENMKIKLETIEKKYVYLTGKNRMRARKKYHALVRSCQKKCSLDKPIYIDRI